MTRCVVCGWQNTWNVPHDILDKLHLGRIAKTHTPTTAAQIIENSYQQVAGEWP